MTHQTLDEALSHASDQLAHALSLVSVQHKKVEPLPSPTAMQVFAQMEEVKQEITTSVPVVGVPVAMRSYIDPIKDELVIDQIYADGSVTVNRAPRSVVESHRIAPGAGIAIKAYERYTVAHHNARELHGELRPGTANNDHPITRQHIRDNHYIKTRDTKLMHCSRCHNPFVVPLSWKTPICKKCAPRLHQ